ncbi:DsbE family thiol:disulfide interchange protein [Tahibacter amnicola]|uniref:DsbE family thiol:disulfide interchange protein n=1 Tax=Tahibacter amnicola TaxID=2976241 RepID=A0ABY6BQ86_9GAMM|nr:DsbE family thiol:disulfide interchange protein [Tahibacter amnicola]UXI70721.1 DsbE family thiol:disulfide interchange protein [Tahibacter amnicola]
MTRVLPLVGFVLLVLLLAFGLSWNRSHDQREVASPLIGKTAPTFSLPVLNTPDQRFGTAELAGQPYLLNVFGSWCPSCVDEHPVLNRYAKQLGVKLVGFNWKDAPGDANAWLAKFGNPYEVIVVDQEGRTAIDFGVYGAPETFLVDAQGVIRLKRVGAITPDYVERTLKPAIAALKRTTP